MENPTPRRALLAWLTLSLAASPIPVLAAEIAPGHVAAPAGPIAFGPRFSAGFDPIISGLSLKSDADLAGGLTALAAAYKKEGTLEQRLALAALASPDAAARLASSDIPKPTLERLAKASARLAKAAGNHPEVAKALTVARAAAEQTKPRIAASDAKISAEVDAFLAVVQAPATETTVDAPVVAQPSAGAAALPPGVRLAKAGEIAGVPEGRPVFNYGHATEPLVAYPSEGADISGLWRSANEQADGPLLQAQYNFDDLEMAKAIVANSKAGQKQIIVGDYSNWFPESKMQEKTGARPDAKRSEAMDYIIANLGPNLELYILKGLSDIGINHNKFTVFAGQNGELLQGGSFNYSGNSQTKHWENVVFTTDAERIAFFQKYHAWLVRRARKFAPDLKPVDPTFDPADPLPTMPVSPEVSLHGVPFPKATGTPNGPGEDKLVEAESLVKEALDILMFSPFPTPKMVAQIEELLKAGKNVRMVADASQIERASLLVPLIKAGMRVKTIVGPDVVLHHAALSHGSFQHEKVMLFDGHMPDGIVKMGDSLNISKNALDHNFENIQFWGGIYVVIEQQHFEYVWGLASDLSQELLAKLEKMDEDFKAGKGHLVSPWQGPAPAAPPEPAAAAAR